MQRMHACITHQVVFVPYSKAIATGKEWEITPQNILSSKSKKSQEAAEYSRAEARPQHMHSIPMLKPNWRVGSKI